MTGLTGVFECVLEFNKTFLAIFTLSLLLIFWSLPIFIEWTKKARHTNKLASFIPGPSPDPVIGNILMFTRSANVLRTITELIKSYNRGVCRIWKGPALQVYVTKPNDIESVLGNMKQLMKSREYGVLSSLMGDGLFTTNNRDKWKSHRKLVTPAFHFSILKSFLVIFHQEATILADKLETKIGKPTDVLTYLALCTLDTICRTAMGVSVNAQNGHYNEFVNDMETVFWAWQERFTKSWYLVPIVFALSSLKKKHDAAAKATLSFTEEVIKKRKQEWEKNKNEYHKKLEAGGKLAFLDLMLGNGMTDRELRDETMTVIIGGQETTATTLSFAFLALALHKDIQEKVHEELDIVFGEDKLSAPSLNDLNQLEYLERFIKETLRLFPPVPIIGRFLENDEKIGEYLIPKGTDISILITLVHRDPEQWKDPEIFNPDRFLPENCKSRHPYAYLPFSAGLRNCIGQKYGMLQMKTILSTVLRRLNLKSSPEHKSLKEIELIMTTTLKSKKGFNIIFQGR